MTKPDDIPADVWGSTETLVPDWVPASHIYDYRAEQARAILSERERCAAPAPADSHEAMLSSDILAELTRARTKFPGKNVTFAALVEEVGELATATFEESRDRVRKEAVQVAVMAMRMVLDGDYTFDDWRQSKGLDALVDTPSQPLVRGEGE